MQEESRSRRPVAAGSRKTAYSNKKNGPLALGIDALYHSVQVDDNVERIDVCNERLRDGVLVLDAPPEFCYAFFYIHTCIRYHKTPVPMPVLLIGKS
jgi:hypothetical protein